ncbi:MAG: spore coat protein CotH, partial [Bacillota bacterium]
MGQKRELVKQFDKDGNGRLNKEERQAARDFLKKEQASRQAQFGSRFPGGFGGFGRRGGPGATTRPAGPGMFGP